MIVRTTIKNSLNEHKVLVQTNDIIQPVAINHKSSGYGSSVNGGELLTLAIATCFCNDLYREATKRNIKISSIDIEACAEFNAEGASGNNFEYKVSVSANATQEEIDELIKHTDTVAEIHNTLRKGVPVTLIK